jgi:hypothetical protein
MALRDYIKKTWVNLSSPAINATNLQYIDNKIDELDKYLVPRLILKTADESVNNSEVLQNDNHLVVALTGGKIYQIETFLKTLASTDSTDIRYTWTYSGTNSYFYRFGVGSGYTETYPIDGRVCIQSSSVITDEFIMGMDSAFPGYIRDTILINCTTSGNLQLKWAQYTAAANNSTIYTGSHMLVREVVAY